MRKSNLAEKFLSLFCSNEHAAAIVGDLLEARHGRASLGFWAELLAIAIPHVLSDLRRNPRQHYFSAMKAWSLFTVTAAFSLAFLEAATKFIPDLRFLVGALLRSWTIGVVIFSCSYSAGQWVLKSARGKEIATSFALYLCSVLVLSPLYLLVTKWNFVTHAPNYANWFSVEAHYAAVQLRDQTGFLAAGLVAGWKRVGRGERITA